MSSSTHFQYAVGVAFKSSHFDDLMAAPTRVDFIEVHAENYLGAGGLPHFQLSQIRAQRPITIHGVGLSIGAAAPLNTQHLNRVAALVERYQPQYFSEHLAWSSHGEVYLGDLLPLRYTRALLDAVVTHVQQIQERLQRKILLENPSHYVQLVNADFDEASFLREVVQRSGCGLLLDVNNLAVSAHNLGFNAINRLTDYPLYAVEQIHLAGFNATQSARQQSLWIDDHGGVVEDATWTLYQALLAITGPRASLIEWDRDVPEWSDLLVEADMARTLSAPFSIDKNPIHCRSSLCAMT